MKLQLLCFLLQLLLEHCLCTRITVPKGSSLELPCLPVLSEFNASPKVWTFNDIIINAEASGSTRMKKDGLFLYISPITAAHQGQYMCLVKENDMDLIRTYDITVIGSITYDLSAVVGSTIHLPCILPHSGPILANALWFKETGFGQVTQVHIPQDSAEMDRMQQLYPMDRDQSVLFRNVVLEDSGIYYCKSAEGEELSTVRLTIKVPPTPVPYSCGEFTEAWEACLDPDSRTGETVLQESLTEFSMKLYSFLKESQPLQNLLLSPLSISTLLSHLLLGARDKTQRAIESALSFPHDFSCVHFHMKKLKEKLATSLQMSSQIYYHPKMTLSESFTNQSVQFYEASPTKLLETSEENTKMINSWVANKTNNKIEKLVDSVSPSTELILLNAVSFQGQWQKKFDVKSTKDLFTKWNGDMVPVQALYHRDYPLAIRLDADLKALVARFVLTGDTSLYILLPTSYMLADLQQVEERMTDAALLQMINKMKAIAPQKSEVTLPKIKLDVEPNMFQLMKKLGLSSLFEDANLCGLYSEDRLVLDEIRHRGFLALTEQGVEAVAVTTVSFSRSYTSFQALHPFVFLLWSDQANVPLFVGRVIEP